MSAISLSNIWKSFDGRSALSSASLEVEWGEVHALLGENGAGKSTLMSVLCGIYAADNGTIRIGEEGLKADTPNAAIELGIGIVHQHFMLIENFTVAEKIFLYCGERLGYRSAEQMQAFITEQAAVVGLSVQAGALISALSIAEKQRVEILKILLGGAKILILDEPTAVLTDDESTAVLSLLREMAAEGRAVVLITHKLREVLAFSDRVTVMRGGLTVMGGVTTGGLTREQLSYAMVGNEAQEIEREFWPLGEVRLSVKNLTTSVAGGVGGISEITFDIRAGEVFGIAGVGGNGQHELVDALIGLSSIYSGTIILEGKNVANASVRERRDNGIRYIPADRFKSGIAANLRAFENFGATDIFSGRYGSWFFVNRARMREDTEAAIQKLNILGCQAETMSRLLSGGNAQKLLLSRELDHGASVVIAHSPTRGLDVQARNIVHSWLLEAVRGGTACILISEDLEEVLGLSTTVAVMVQGKIAGTLNAGEGARVRVGELMLGHA
jgi:simple sugar transport system ATP-binding protein